MSSQIVTVAGIGADGWPGLSPLTRDAISQAQVIVGAPRQLALLPAELTGQRVPLPSPLLPGLPELIARHAGAALVVLASGDPMFNGIGATLARLLGPARLRVLPHPSSVSLAAARLGWPLDDIDVVSLVGRPASCCTRCFSPDGGCSPSPRTRAPPVTSARCSRRAGSARAR